MAAWSGSHADENDTVSQLAGMGVFAGSKEQMSFAANMSGKINIIAALGLALGGALGMAGAMVTRQNVQAILWAMHCFQARL